MCAPCHNAPHYNIKFEPTVLSLPAACTHVGCPPDRSQLPGIEGEKATVWLLVRSRYQSVFGGRICRLVRRARSHTLQRGFDRLHRVFHS